MKKSGATTYIPWRLLAYLSLVSLAILIYYIIKPGTAEQFGLGINLLSILYSFALGCLCFQGSPSLREPRRDRSTPHMSRRFSPALLGMTTLGFTLSQIVWFGEIVVLKHIPAFPSPQHVTGLIMYPFLIGAVLFLPAQHLTLVSRLRILLDSLIIMTALVILCYYYLLTPLLAGSQATVLEKIMASVLPQADLVVMFCLLLVTLRFGEDVLRPVLIMLSIASFCMFALHITHLYELLYKGYNHFSPSNALYLLTGMLTVSAAQTVSRIVKHNETEQTIEPEKVEETGLISPPESWKAMLPSALILIFGLLVFLIWLSGGNPHFPGYIIIVYSGGLLVLLLMILRQFLAVYEMSKLQKAVGTRNLSLSLLNTQLERQATSDPLTGLPNHRTLVEKLETALENARATPESCSVIFLDIDHFKSINDRYGHPVGDVVLRNFGTLVKTGLRATDWVGRWGGEEFLAILPETGSLEAYHVAERVRQLIEQRVLAGNGELKVTCSLGVATYPQDATDTQSLILAADQAMYTAKRLGRNQTRSAHEPLVLAMGIVGEEVETMEEAEMLAAVESLSAMLYARDHYTGQHARRVADLSLKLALRLGLRGHEALIVSLGGLLHDVGKVAIPDAVLLKQEKFSETDRQVMLRHPLIGAEALAALPALQPVAQIVRGHHERLNGSGYPDGLADEAIPLGARIVAVADSYDAMISTRVYRQAHSSAEALKELQRGAGQLFDPRVVDALIWLLKYEQPVAETAS